MSDQTAFIEAQFAQMIQHVRMIHRQHVLSHADAMQLIDILSQSDSPFGQTCALRMGAITDELLNTAGFGSSPQGASQCQEHLYIHHYLGANTWSILQSEMSISHKLETLCRHMIETCFLRNPDEVTRRNMVALVMKASKADVSIDASECLNHVHQVRSIMKSLRVLDNGPKGPKKYPKDAIQFHAMFPSSTVLTVDPPVECIFDETSFAIMCGQMPMRKSHKSATQHHVPSSAARTDSKSDDKLVELTKFILGHGIASNMQAMPQAPHWLHVDKREQRTSSQESMSAALKSEPAASPPKPLPAPSQDRGMTHEPLLDDADVLPHADRVGELHGSLDELRDIVDSRFQVVSTASSSKKPTVSTADVPKLHRRLRTKTPMSDIPAPTPSIGARKRPAGPDSMWQVLQHTRKDGSGKTYNVYVSPDGVRYPSLKKATMHGMPQMAS